ncbi:MAG: hypothetical protein SAMD01599839_07360 [Rectinema sp.]
MYKRNGLYYLLLSEGGTEYGHMLTVFRAGSPWGPYEPCPRNPVLTHRNLAQSPIQCVGHGDLVDDAAGNWWLVCLGVRPINSLLLHNLGRETFLAPVSWDSDGWPIIGDNGVISLEMEGPLPGTPQNDGPAGVIQPDRRGGDGRAWDWRDEFDGARLSPEWNFIRARQPSVATIEKGGGLVLSGGEAGLSDRWRLRPLCGDLSRPLIAFSRQWWISIPQAKNRRRGSPRITMIPITTKPL